MDFEILSMADDKVNEDASSSQNASESSNSTIEVNIKTLDSQIYTFRVNKNITVYSFKEQIAGGIGVPAAQQRLIFRGRVIKDDHHLAEYKDGHTLHLVVRQPVQSQPSTGTASGSAGENAASRGTDAPAAFNNRAGQVSHSVVLETFNVADQGDVVPDVSRLLGAVLNSLGMENLIVNNNGAGNQASSTGSSDPSQAPRGAATNGTSGNTSGRSRESNQAHPAHTPPSFPFPSGYQYFQAPRPGAMAVPLQAMAIPDALTALSGFTSRMEQGFVLSGFSHQSSSPAPSSSAHSPPSSGNFSNSRGLPTPELLGAVIRQVQQLLSGRAGAALLHLASRLASEAAVNDPVVRNQIQAEAIQAGIYTHHLGALLLELGRTIMTLRMGQSPAEAVVNAGPAVYISPSGPNPIMVQPLPYQSTPFFGASSTAPLQATAGIQVSAAPGDIQRNINIHIHAGTSVSPRVSSFAPRANNGDVAHANERQSQEQTNSNQAGLHGAMHVLPMRTVVAAVPSRPPGEASGHILSVVLPLHARSQESNAGQPIPSQSPSLTVSSGAQVESHARNIDGNSQISQVPADSSRQGTSSVLLSASRSDVEGNQSQKDVSVNGTETVAEGYSTSTAVEEPQPQFDGSQPKRDDDGTSAFFLMQQTNSAKDAANNQGTATSSSTSTGPKAAPLGLGPGGLQPLPSKKRSKPAMQQQSKEVETSNANENQQSLISTGQSILQALATKGASNTSRAADASGPSMSRPSVIGGQAPGNAAFRVQGSGEQIDVASVMSDLIHSPAMENLLSRFSDQAGGVPVASLSNALEQLSQSPPMRNALNRIVQQVEDSSPDLTSMLSGLGSGRGMDLSGIFNQMMPVVAQALSKGSAQPVPSEGVDRELQTLSGELRNSATKSGQGSQISQVDLQQVVDKIERLDAAGDVFQTMVENTCHLSGLEIGPEDLFNEEGLAQEFMEMLYREIRRRHESESGGKS
ncbi:large proline-rich protein BAG6 isoform X2 [Amborella trichopoda]|uniref:large proline-rich protein BAG6 isoform X2 n=1 Tax=Amborella trichopoda TaxID=13333 RepID=UPI0009C0D807|nr:large proline-rich protein BAG6 isoform X2 [Amborella trichopoda]|eukprot:XP_020532313.1 large proline-rich protein BAG6 isoform X2 [Amborella trichopoda]